MHQHSLLQLLIYQLMVNVHMEFSEKISPEINSDERSIIRGILTAGWWLLAAHEEAVTFYWPGRDGEV